MRVERIILPGEHRSHASHRSYGSHSSRLFLLILLLAAGTTLHAQPAARKLLPETAVLDRVDGKVVHVDANDTWLFVLTMDVKTLDFQVPTGTRLVLLPSATLGRLIDDANDRYTPRYRLSARVTRFKGKNFLLPTYYLPLSRFKDDKSQDEGERKTESSDPNQQSKIKNQKSDDPEFAIPPEVLEQLKKQRPLRVPRRDSEADPKPAQTPPDRVLVDCVGRIESCRVGSQPTRLVRIDRAGAWGKTPPYVFVPYGLGWKLGDVRYDLLPCTALEQTLQRQTQALDPIRFSVAGLVTEYKGRKYLLLQRAAVAYNYGNFGR